MNRFMNRFLLTSAITVVSMVGVAHAADTDSATADLTATAASTCYFADANLTGTFDLGSQIDGTTAILTAAGVNATIDGYCNDSATTLSLTSTNGGLLAATVATVAGSGTFAGVVEGPSGRKLPYSTSGSTWAGVSFDTELVTDGTPTNGALATGAINGTISTTITLNAQTDPVLAGTYTDTITVSVQTAP